MKKIALTGAGGFLGFHVRAAALDANLEIAPITLGRKFDQKQAEHSLEGASKVIHLAGVNRGTEEEIAEGNILFSQQLVSGLRGVENPPAEVIFANSIQAGNETIYGDAKKHAGEILEKATQAIDVNYSNIFLPNLFGEFGRPFYNSVVATFCHQIAQGQIPKIHQDKELLLLHAQDAADILLGRTDVSEMNDLSEYHSVSGVKALLEEFEKDYSAGEFPDMSTTFRRNLFNTYRSYTFPSQAPIEITRHADQRGSFFEIVRSRGGTGQTSFSTTVPGVIRGDHFHRRKVERFTVLAGEAEISLRRIYDDEVFRFRISGGQPKSVDMPTFYTHKIENVGTDTLYTAFWTNDIFDPENPDTIAEAV